MWSAITQRWPARLSAKHWRFLMSVLADLSNAVTDLAESVRPRIVTITGSSGRQSSGFVWAKGLVIASEEVLDGDEQIKIGWDDGREAVAAVKGRDPST